MCSLPSSLPLSLGVDDLVCYLLVICKLAKFQETLQKAGEIFGPDNKDLYAIFEGLISRNVH